MIDSIFAPVRLPLPEANSGGWLPYPLFSGATQSLSFMGCHISVLSPGHSPHPAHAHVEEEVLIVLAGTAEILIAESPNDPYPRLETLQPGQFSYYPAWQHHTIRNISNSPVTYLMFKWRSGSERVGDLEATVFDYRAGMQLVGHKTFSPTLVFEASTCWLNRLHCHVTRLQPAAGYQAHADPYDVALLMLSGRVEINSRIVEPHGIAFFSAGEMHDMKNASHGLAQYLVFEFEPHHERHTDG
jgi:mannose-6-phosphate isomerase-like protein (cupin superfamily)